MTDAAKIEESPWIEWPGGNMPVGRQTIVHVRYRVAGDNEDREYTALASLKSREPTDSASMDEKAAFEAWVEGQPWFTQNLLEHDQTVDGGYVYLTPRWLAWQAAPKYALSQREQPAEERGGVPRTDAYQASIVAGRATHTWSEFASQLERELINLRQVHAELFDQFNGTPAPEHSTGPWRIAKTSCSCNREDDGHGWAVLKNSRMVRCLGCLMEVLEQAAKGDEAIRKAAERVVLFDWSDNDSDAVEAIEALRVAIAKYTEFGK